MAPTPDPPRRPAPAVPDRLVDRQERGPATPETGREPGSWIDRLRVPALLSAMPMAERAAIMALRRGLRSGPDPASRIAAMTAVLGGGFAAMRFQLLIETLGAAWPDPFLVRRPCCRQATPDEALLADLLGVARRGDRAAFDGLLCDMIDDDARSLIWSTARGFVRMERP